jgi:Glycosyl transferases group 1
VTAGPGAGRLELHHGTFAGLVDAARRELRRHRYERAAVAGQLAAQFAWLNHAGVFASPELEDVLASVGAALPDWPRRRAAAPGPPTVLHVVTQAYPTGGSTQAVTRWIEGDRERRHAVCITRQRGGAVPDKLRDALGPAGDLRQLDVLRGGLLRRAATLRALASTVDTVLLHTHPYDVVPVIALAGAPGSPAVVYVDHADHVFWVGAGVSGIVMHMRDSGRLVALTRRGIDPAHSTVTPRPLRVPTVDIPVDEAKRQVGVQPHQVLIVTAADASKYRPVTAPGFLDVLVPLVDRNPRTVLLAAGPGEEPEWVAARTRTGGRVRPLGLLPDATVLQRAADLYVDSYPFASLTSLLEAGSLGIPVASYRGHPPECAVFGSDTRGLDDHLVTASEPEEFRQKLERLIRDPGERAALGERTRQAILASHTGAGWQSEVDRLYRSAARSPAPARPKGAAVSRQTGRLDVLVDLVMVRTGFSEGVDGVIRDHLGLLGWHRRTAAWWRLARAGSRPGLRRLLPEWALSRMARLRRRLASRPAARGAPPPPETGTAAAAPRIGEGVR